MSDAAIEVPEHEHVNVSEGGLGRWIAIFTAIVATVGAIIGHEVEETGNEALILKNEAGLRKTDAADQWAYYQAVSTKSHLMELAMTLVPEPQRAPFADKITKYDKQKDEIKAKADDFEAASAKANARSEALAGPRGNYVFGLALLQVAVSVGSVTMLTRQRWLFVVALLLSAIGAAIAVLGYLAI
jgi:hypothetical protein